MIYDISYILVPLDAGLDHVGRHELEPLVEMVPEVWVRPVEVADEGLERVQLPEQVLGGRAPVAGNTQRSSQGDM